MQEACYHGFVISSLVEIISSILVRFLLQWQKLTADEVKDTIYKLSKKGLTPSQIGVILRDSHGVNQVRITI